MYTLDQDRPRGLQEAVQLANVARNPGEPSSEYPNYDEPLHFRLESG